MELNVFFKHFNLFGSHLTLNNYIVLFSNPENEWSAVELID